MKRQKLDEKKDQVVKKGSGARPKSSLQASASSKKKFSLLLSPAATSILYHVFQLDLPTCNMYLYESKQSSNSGDKLALEINSMDDSNTSYIHFGILEPMLDDFMCKVEGEIGISPKATLPVLQIMKDFDVELSMSNDSDLIDVSSIQSAKEKTSFSLSTYSLTTEAYPLIPQSVLACTVVMSAAKFEKIIKNAAVMGTYVHITFAKNYVTFTASSKEKGKFTKTIELAQDAEDSGSSDMEEEAEDINNLLQISYKQDIAKAPEFTKVFFLSKLSSYAKSHSLNSIVKIQCGIDNVPIILDYSRKNLFELQITVSSTVDEDE